MVLVLFRVHSNASNFIGYSHNERYWASEAPSYASDIYAADTPTDASEGGTPVHVPPDKNILKATTQHLPKDPAIGFVFGSQSERCDILLDPDIESGISKTQFAITFNPDNGLLLLRNLSKRGTRVQFHDEGRAVNLKTQRVLSPEENTEIFLPEWALSIISSRGDAPPTEYREYLRHLLSHAPNIGQLRVTSSTNVTPSVDVAQAKYRLDREIGRGACGIVYRAIERSTGAIFAIKTFHKDSAQAQLWNESQILQSCKHDNIIQFYEFLSNITHNSMLIMEYAPYGDIFSQHRQSKLSPTEARQVIRHILQGLRFLHNKGIIHRDVKPGNILLISRDPIHAKLGDFGTATAGSHEHRTYAGTERYMAPEVLNRLYTSKIDIWSLGIVTGELWIGLPKYQDRETWLNMVRDPGCWVKLLQGHNPTNTRHLLDFLTRTVEVDPNARMTASQCLGHAFLASISSVQGQHLDVPSYPGGPTAELPDTARFTEENEGTVSRGTVPVSQALSPIWVNNEPLAESFPSSTTQSIATSASMEKICEADHFASDSPSKLESPLWMCNTEPNSRPATETGVVSYFTEDNGSHLALEGRSHLQLLGGFNQGNASTLSAGLGMAQRGESMSIPPLFGIQDCYPGSLTTNELSRPEVVASALPGDAFTCVSALTGVGGPSRSEGEADDPPPAQGSLPPPRAYVSALEDAHQFLDHSHVDSGGRGSPPSDQQPLGEFDYTGEATVLPRDNSCTGEHRHSHLSSREVFLDRPGLAYMVIRRQAVSMRTSDFQLSAVQILAATSRKKQERDYMLKKLKWRDLVDQSPRYAWMPFQDSVFLCQIVGLEIDLMPLLSHAKRRIPKRDENYLLRALSTRQSVTALPQQYLVVRIDSKSVTCHQLNRTVRVTDLFRLVRPEEPRYRLYPHLNRMTTQVVRGRHEICGSYITLDDGRTLLQRLGADEGDAKRIISLLEQALNPPSEANPSTSSPDMASFYLADHQGVLDDGARGEAGVIGDAEIATVSSGQAYGVHDVDPAAAMRPMTSL